jgi:hypothetical protein
LCLNFLVPTDEYFALLLMVAAVPVLSLALMLIGSRIKLELFVPEFALKNGNFNITICISNNTFVPISSADINISCEIYELNEVYKNESIATISLSPFKKQKITLEQKYDKYIFVKFKTDSIVIHDFLGIFKKKIRCNDYSEISIIPNIYSEIEAPIINVTVKNNGDVSVREFRDGDLLSHIHQKLSAKSEVNYTRVFEDEVNLPLLTLDIFGSDDFNKAFEEYAATAYTLISDNVSMEMLNFGFDITPIPVNDIKTLQKHLVNVVKNINTQKYNEYISSYDVENYSIVYNFSSYDVR